MSTSLLVVEAAVAGYGANTVLNGLDLSIAPRGRLALLGRNGVGKTTALRTIMGLAALRQGRILFAGEDISALGPRQRALCGLGYVPQTRDVFRSLTVEENLVAGLKRRARAAIDEAYVFFPRLAERRKHGAGQLSGGEQQMLSVARALLGQPKLLLLDEPLEGLAPIIRVDLLNAFTQMSLESGITIVIAEQQVGDVLRFADQAVVMDRGAVVHRALAGELLQDNHALERLLGVGVH